MRTTISEATLDALERAILSLETPGVGARQIARSTARGDFGDDPIYFEINAIWTERTQETDGTVVMKGRAGVAIFTRFGVDRRVADMIANGLLEVLTPRDARRSIFGRVEARELASRDKRRLLYATRGTRLPDETIGSRRKSTIVIELELYEE